MSVQLRAAHAMDASKVGGLLTDFVADTSWMPRLHSAAQDVSHADMLITRGWVTIVGARGAVDGFLARDAGKIHALYVRRGLRNQGIGAALLKDAMTRQSALSLWTFEANTGAHRFYERHGFVEAERTDGAGNDEKLPDIRYEWHAREPNA